MEDGIFVDTDEGNNVGVHLRNDERVDIEQFSQSLHWQVLAERAVNELHALRAWIILDDAAIIKLLHQVNFLANTWNGTRGNDSRPDEQIWCRQVVEES